MKFKKNDIVKGVRVYIFEREIIGEHVVVGYNDDGYCIIIRIFSDGRFCGSPEYITDEQLTKVGERVEKKSFWRKTYKLDYDVF